MRATVESSVFSFIDELTEEIREGRVERNDAVRLHSKPVVFCDSFFGQLFKSIGVEISGFGDGSQQTVSRWAARSRREHFEDAEHQQLRLLVAKYLKFCKIHSDIDGQGYGPTVSRVNYQQLHETYLVDLMDAIEVWAKLDPDRKLIVKASSESSSRYKAAVEETQWLTRRSKSRFDLLKSIWPKLTS